jgi:hypothetical protein
LLQCVHGIWTKMPFLDNGFVTCNRFFRGRIALNPMSERTARPGAGGCRAGVPVRKIDRPAKTPLRVLGRRAGEDPPAPLPATRRAPDHWPRGLSLNDCRRRLLTGRSAVRILFAEPNIPTSNSLVFRLTARRRETAENGQYSGKAASLWYGKRCRRPTQTRSQSHSRAGFSGSPPSGARLVNCFRHGD